MIEKTTNDEENSPHQGELSSSRNNTTLRLYFALLKSIEIHGTSSLEPIPWIFHFPYFSFRL